MDSNMGISVPSAEERLELPKKFVDQMTPELFQNIQNLKNSIDVHSRAKTEALGREEQASLAKFYDDVLSGVGTSEIGEAGQLLVKLVSQISGYGDECNSRGGIFSFFIKAKSKLPKLRAKYRDVTVNIDTIADELRKKDLEIGKISRNFEVMYEENCRMYEFLTILIYACELILKEEKEKLFRLQSEAQQSSDYIEQQKVADFKEDILRFERRVYDLKLSRTIAIQQAVQLKLVQKNSETTSESIRKTINISMPLWKSQMAIALGMKEIRKGLDGVAAVREKTNEMLIASSAMNKQLVRETAKAVEDGVIDVETLNSVNQNLLDALNGSYQTTQEVIQRSAEGASELQVAKKELEEAIKELTQ